MEATAPHPALWTAEEVAKFLKVSRSWVYQRAERGDLPSLRVGGLRRFEPAAILAWARGEARDTGAKIIPLAPKIG